MFWWVPGERMAAVIQMRIRVQTLQTPERTSSSSVQAGRSTAIPRVAAPSLTCPAIVRTTPHQPSPNVASALPESNDRSEPRLNMKNLREQARALAREEPDQFVRRAVPSHHARKKKALIRPISQF